MKKARFLLILICATSLLGGVYAAKINDAISFWIYIRTSNTTNRCTIWIHGFWTLPFLAGDAPVGSTYLTTNNNGTCSVLLPYYTAS